MHPVGEVAAVVPACDEADRVALTVTAAAQLPGVDLVVVVDDGSQDATAEAARAAAAPALVVRHARSGGKAAAMETGAEAVRAQDRQEARAQPRLLLFLDADLGESAAGAAPVVEPVRAGTADMAVALLPQARERGGGRGLVVRLARAGIRRRTGWTAAQPLCGQRCLTRRAWDAARPPAGGFGVETALTIDLLRRGMRVREVPAALAHRVTGSGWRAQRHRARQFLHVARALAARELAAWVPFLR